MWAVVKIFEYGMSVGLIEVYRTYKAALKAAIEEVEFEADMRNLSIKEYSDPKTTLSDNDYYIFSDEYGDCAEGCEYGKDLIIQIKRVDHIAD